jgi:Family of unknown function (DUF6496)
MARKYSASASKDVEGAMHKRKRGTLKSGGSGKKVTSRKQAIAIGLSEARRKGKKVPAKKSGKSSTSKKSGTKKSGSSESSSRKPTAKKSSGRKTARSKK